MACHFAEEVAGSAERALATGKPAPTSMAGTDPTLIDAVSAAATAGVRPVTAAGAAAVAAADEAAAEAESAEPAVDDPSGSRTEPPRAPQD